MRRYQNLSCPKCSAPGRIAVDLDEPDNPYCLSCNEDIDLNKVRVFVDSWAIYIRDVDELLRREKEVTCSQ